MNYPIPGLTIKIKAEQDLSYLNYNQSAIESTTQLKEVTNYEYESRLNDEKRKLILIKKEYLGAIISEMDEIMKYNESSQYIDNKLKRAYNPNIK